MKAMILAAGKGTRVQPLSHDLPKPMIPILGKPVMEYLVEKLVAHNFTDIMVNVSHLPEFIERYFGAGQRWGANIGYSFEGHIENNKVVGEPIGSAGGIKRIQQFGGFFDDTFLVVCGDAIFDFDLTAAVRKHWQSAAVASVVVHPVAKERVSNYGVVVHDSDGRVTSFQEKPSENDAKSNLVNTGVYIFEPQILDHIPADTMYDLGSQLLPNLIAKKLPLHAISSPRPWVDIGRLSDYWNAHQELMRGALRDVQIPGKEVLPGVWTGLNTSVDWDEVLIEGPVYIGANSRIESGCEILGPSWISHGCHLRGGATMVRSILFEHTLLHPHANIFEAMIFGRHCVDRNGIAINSEDGQLDWVGDARSVPV